MDTFFLLLSFSLSDQSTDFMVLCLYAKSRTRGRNRKNQSEFSSQSTCIIDSDLSVFSDISEELIPSMCIHPLCYPLCLQNSLLLNNVGGACSSQCGRTIPNLDSISWTTTISLFSESTIRRHFASVFSSFYSRGALLCWWMEWSVARRIARSVVWIA